MELRELLSNIQLLIISAIIITIASIILGCYKNNWLWLTVSGASVTIIGLILSARPLMRMGYSKWRESQMKIDCGSLLPTPNEIEEDRQSDKDIYAYLLGICMSIAGVLISLLGSWLV